ncbi:amino acid racemase [Marinilactibacillus sp. XAAS-LB27]|uniref:aspartate/glutamate racemase family protein n=1 Tax=unclassified Marinilactibacillus TaxID=2632303 RepID=UPI001CE453C1|nr:MULTISPECIES: amino acid racemase [unclassified Marinilactibacillus]MEC6748875.1 amino acid racemase [Marinilactibacillus sp. XAAS-LB27]
MNHHQKVIGVVGGMGPEATASFFYKLIRSTEAKKDQDHYRIVIDNNPKIPDRTKAILGEGESPLSALIETAKNVERAGADVIAVPCITSNYFLAEVQKEVKTPIANVFEALEQYLKTDGFDVRKVGILCTTGTRKMGLFQKNLPFDICYPSEQSQESKVMEAIYGPEGIKQGNTGIAPKRLLQEAALELIDAGVDVIVSGCTEIELALKQEDIEIPLVDPMQVLAQSLTNPTN